MTTEAVDIVDCIDPLHHRVLWRDSDATLLDHPTLDLEGEEILGSLLGHRELPCLARVAAWRSARVANVAAVLDRVTPPSSPHGIEALWQATGLDVHTRRALEHGRIAGLGDVLEVLARYPGRIEELRDQHTMTYSQGVAWAAALVASTDRWSCPSCGATCRASNAERHWHGSQRCYWFTGRAELDGWRRVRGRAIRPDSWPPPAAALFEVHLARARTFSGTYTARFVRFAVTGVSAGELLDAIAIVRCAKARRTYAQAAVIVAQLSATDAAASGSDRVSLLQAADMVLAA